MRAEGHKPQVGFVGCQRAAPTPPAPHPWDHVTLRPPSPLVPCQWWRRGGGSGVGVEASPPVGDPSSPPGGRGWWGPAGPSGETHGGWPGGASPSPLLPPLPLPQPLPPPPSSHLRPLSEASTQTPILRGQPGPGPLPTPPPWALIGPNPR